MSRRDPKRSDLVKVDFTLKPRFSNTLPDIPFEGKFMPCPFVPISRFVEYKESTLEKELKHNLLCEDDLGINVDLIDLDQYNEDTEELEIDEKDQYLLEDESTSKMNSKRSAQHKRLVPWMRKTEYISTEYNRFGLSADRQETKLGYNLKKNQQVDDMYRDRQSQIDAINKTFEDVKKPVKQHYNKKGVYAVEECYAFPDFDNWKYQLAFVQFDGESVSTNVPEGLRKTAAELSLIRGMQMDNEQFAVHFTPTVETIQKHMDDQEAGKLFDDDEKYEYNLNREYMWKIEQADQKGEKDHFIMHWKDGKVAYDEITSNMKMTRRRKMYFSKKSKLSVQFRDYQQAEVDKMQTRFENLFKPAEKTQPEEANESDSDEEVKKDGKSSSSSSAGSDSEGEKKKKKKKSESSSSSSSSSADDSSDDEKAKKSSDSD